MAVGSLPAIKFLFNTIYFLKILKTFFEKVFNYLYEYKRTFPPGG